MNIGLLGGSFDPVHSGHRQLARSAVRQLKLDRLYWVPARVSPFKVDRPPLSMAARLRCLRAVVKKNRRYRLALWDIRRKGPSFTVDTIRRYHKRHPSHKLFLILGSDAARGFSRWKNPHGILRHATLAVATRPGGGKAPKRVLGHPVVFLKGVFPNVSSTQLRARSHAVMARRSVGAGETI